MAIAERFGAPPSERELEAPRVMGGGAANGLPGASSSESDASSPPKGLGAFGFGGGGGATGRPGGAAELADAARGEGAGATERDAERPGRGGSGSPS
jgi:hypothetical protein